MKLNANGPTDTSKTNDVKAAPKPEEKKIEDKKPEVKKDEDKKPEV